MEWSAVTWRRASPSQQEPEHRWHGGEAVQLVFSWTLPQALPEASSGVSPSQKEPNIEKSVVRALLGGQSRANQ